MNVEAREFGSVIQGMEERSLTWHWQRKQIQYLSFFTDCSVLVCTSPHPSVVLSAKQQLETNVGRVREDQVGCCVVKLINQRRMCMDGRQGPLACCTGGTVPLWLGRSLAEACSYPPWHYWAFPETLTNYPGCPTGSLSH